MHRGFFDLNKITLAVLKKKKKELVILRNGGPLSATRYRSIPARLRREAQRNHAQKECEAMQRNFFHEADFSSFITM